MTESKNKTSSLWNRKKYRITLIFLLSATVVSVVVWQTYRSHVQQIKIKESAINPIVFKVIELKFKDYGDDLTNLLARNLTESVNTLKSPDHFYGSEIEVKTALEALAAGNLTPIKTLIDRASKKPGLDHIRSAQIQANLGAVGYFFEDNGYFVDKHYDGWTPVLKYYELAAKLNPDNINAWRNLGYLFLHRFAETEISPPPVPEWIPGNNVKQPQPNFSEYNKLVEKAIQAYATVIALAEKQDNLVELAQGYIDLGNLYSEKRPVTDESQKISLGFYEKTVSIYKSIGRKKEMANIYDKLGFLYIFTLQKYQQGFDYYEKALPLFQELDDKERMNTIYGTMGLVSWSSGNCEKSIESLEKELNLLANNLGKSDLLNQSYNDFNYRSLAECYEHIGNLDKALYYYQKALDQSENSQSDLLSAYILSQNSSFSSRIGSVFLKLNKTEDALTYFQKALSLNQKSGQQEGIAMSYVNMGDVYMKTGDKLKAEEAFKKGHEVLKKLNNPPHLKEVEDRLNMFSK